MRPCGLSLFLFLAAAGCGGHGATQFGGSPPSPELTFGSCAFCHHEIAATMTATGGHHDLGLKCEACHTDLEPGIVGRGHRSVPACVDCHTEQATHHEPAGTGSQCTGCHTPHGSGNILLVRELIMTPSGASRPITFTSLAGRADRSFASVSNPGSGVCEVCHTQTRFYRSDGSGDDHFPFACLTCHAHAAGFAPG